MPVRKVMKYLKYVLACLVVVVIYNLKFAQFQISTQLKAEPATTVMYDPRTDGLVVNPGQINYDETVDVTEDGEEKPPPYELFSEETTQQLQTITVENEIDENLLYENVRPGFVRLTPTGMKSIENEVTHELSMQEPYKDRMANIRQNCGENIDKILDLSRYIYNDKHKFVMCEIPKAACTSWKRFWWHLAGFDGYKTVEGEKLIINRGYITTLSELPVHEALTKLKEYTTFVIKRHPFERIVSAHSSKFTNRHKEDTYKKRLGLSAANKFLPPLVHNIEIRRYMGTDFEEKLNQSVTYQALSTEEKNQVRQSVISLNIGEIDFDIFTKMVIEEYQQHGPEKVDVHWRNSIDLCNPCAVNFDYVINFENLHEDSNRLLDYLQREDPEENKVFFGSRRNLVNSNYTYDKLHSLPKETIVELLQIYKRDLEVFGFDDMNI